MAEGKRALLDSSCVRCYGRAVDGAPHSSAWAPIVREPPRWWPVISGVFVGYLWALITLGLAALALGALGLLNAGAGNVYPRALLAGPFQPYGAWALTANAVIAFAVLAVTTAFVVRSVRERLGERPSPSLVFLTLALTGYAPFLFFSGRLRLSGLIGLFLTAALVRWVALPGRAPADLLARAAERFPRPADRRSLWFLAGAGSVVGVGIVVGYGLLHPLDVYRTDIGSAQWQRKIDDRPYAIRRVKPGKTYTAALAVRNGGFADLRLTAVDAGPGANTDLTGYYVTSDPFPLSPRMRSGSAANVPARDQRDLMITLRAPACEGATLAKLPTIRVHYEVLGRAATAVLPVNPAVGLRCNAGRRRAG